MNKNQKGKAEALICPVCKDCEMDAGYIYNAKAVLNMWVPEEKFLFVIHGFDSEKKTMQKNEVIPLADHWFLWAIRSESALRYKTYRCPKCNILLTDLSKPQKDVDPKKVKKVVWY